MAERLRADGQDFMSRSVGASCSCPIDLEVRPIADSGQRPVMRKRVVRVRPVSQSVISIVTRCYDSRPNFFQRFLDG
jgi:hypothetical protein